MWKFVSENQISPLLNHPKIYESVSSPRQKLPLTYWQNGYVDVIRRNTILEKSSMVGDVVLGIEIDEPVFDIDYPDDVARVAEGLRRLEQGLPLSDEKDTDDRHPV